MVKVQYEDNPNQVRTKHGTNTTKQQGNNDIDTYIELILQYKYMFNGHNNITL